MKKNTLTRAVYTVLQLTWGIVQNSLGIVLFLLLILIAPKRRHGYYHGAIVSYWRFRFSMGLGMFIFFGHEGKPEEKQVFVHEWGHTVQSIILGPLFFFVIAIPSTVWAFTPAFVKMRKEKGIRYCDLFCEKWANRLGEKLTGEPAVWK